MRNVFLHLFIAGLLALSLAACGAARPPAAVPTPLPTLTPIPTQIPFPTWTPAPPATPVPTYTPLPTLTPAPTRPDLPTSTPLPTYTALPTYTPVPTPTPTPTPTATPKPTPTATPTMAEKWRTPPGRVTTVANLTDGSEPFWDDRKPMILVGCHAGPYKSESKAAIFSHDGDFGRTSHMVRVTGFSTSPSKGKCYEMAVWYAGENEYCYWTEYSGLPSLPPSLFGCSGWEQMTPEFRLRHPEAYRLIFEFQWRRIYSKWKP